MSPFRKAGGVWGSRGPMASMAPDLTAGPPAGGLCLPCAPQLHSTYGSEQVPQSLLLSGTMKEPGPFSRAEQQGQQSQGGGGLRSPLGCPELATPLTSGDTGKPRACGHISAVTGFKEGSPRRRSISLVL